MTRYAVIQTSKGYVVASAHMIDNDIQTFAALGNDVYKNHDQALKEIKRMLGGRSNFQNT